MKLTRLCKAADSLRVQDCPAMYLDEDPGMMVGQGKRLDEDATAQLLHLGEDEAGVAIPTETVLRAAALVLTAHGRTELGAEIETFVAGRWGVGL
ncbi:hypothetical protein [Pseudonocardia acaciae]|uniref:hypothetical protein n=1 Tax=Pseudonocardia acaciae TaxID=551276 RepID=UPI00048B5E1E|nr:hypothetical protein [Pseudonocardia acaciae]